MFTALRIRNVLQRPHSLMVLTRIFLASETCSFSILVDSFDVSLLTIEEGFDKMLRQHRRHANSHLPHFAISPPTFEPFVDPLFEGVDFYTSLTRAGFKDLCQYFFCSTRNPVEKVFRKSKTGKSNVHEIVLVGVYTHIPRIVTLVSNFLEPNKSANPDEAIAYGAAIQAV
ncbi:heat shock protein 70 [Flagelloscypha sp. PMI_526]|nr:heat shock protein 70 [Flagelloscypha sp. PMI_526]